MPELSRLEFLEKFLANNFAFLDAEDNTFGQLHRGDIVDLPLLRTLLAIRQNYREPSFWEVMEPFVSLIYASLVASRTLLQWLLTSLSFTLDSEDLCFWYKRKQWFLWTMAAAKAAENHEDEWDSTWYFWWGIYTSIPTWTHSQNSLAAEETQSLKISSHGTSLKWLRRPTQSARK